MATGLLIGLAIAGVLACPVMMLLGRRGVGPGCILGRCVDDQNSSAESLRRSQREPAAQIAELEEGERRRGSGDGNPRRSSRGLESTGSVGARRLDRANRDDLETDGPGFG
jgi:hypothetical protein